MLVCRKHGGELKTIVYRKVTNISSILNSLSIHPVSHKVSCVRTLYRRVEIHCSEPADKKAEAQYLRKLFTVNGHLCTFIEKCRRGDKHILTPSSKNAGEEPNEENSTGQPEPTRWRAIPYIAGVSEKFARLVSEFGIGVDHRPEATIHRQLMRPKDAVPVNQKSGVIYRTDCGQANYCHPRS
ncbi:unnamed protein product [Dibothriocephalus latus]|uniref:Helix-turn-helix domain-containing protein n=1 Tax=Dibothriocephalus latus TaxID=60516 RepID=A0A3P6PQ72_DIBLA|nr:unnamed protein product [Dibothriocephalus latus]